MAERHYAQGQKLAARGDLNAAAEEYREALLFAPDNTEYRLALATILIDAGRLAEAQSHIEELLQENPTNGVINLLRARLAMKRNRLNLATQYYQRAVYEYWPASELPKRRQARWELVDLLARTGQRNALIAELIQLYSEGPHTPQEKAKIGALLLNNGAASEAMQVFRDLAKQSPNDPAAHIGLAQVYFAQGDFVSARHEYQRAARLDPHNHDITEALALTNEIIDMDPDLPTISLAERFRRSQNLLSRVLKDLRECPAASVPVPTPQVQPATPEPSTKKFFEQLKDKLASPLRGKDTKTTLGSTAAPAAGKQTGASPQPTVAPASAMEQRLKAADNLQAIPPRTDQDSSSELQNTAEGLWQDRAQICGATPVNDRALETVMARLTHE
jgi:tetratricopeptide (TPR) repeat protein